MNIDWVGALSDDQFVFDSEKCTLTLTVKVKLTFLDEPEYRAKWENFEEKKQFWEKLKGKVESTFNSNVYKLVPSRVEPKSFFLASQNQPCCEECPCGGGVVMKLRVTSVQSGSADWSLKVYAGNSKAGGRNRPASSGVGFPASGKLYKDSNEDATFLLWERADGTGVYGTQTPSVHEFGHALGLHHPGRGKRILVWGFIPWRRGGNDPESYRYVGLDENGNVVNGLTDLMGLGKGLRPFYFALWRENMNSRYEHCVYQFS